jgi:hypothetical protein
MKSKISTPTIHSIAYVENGEHRLHAEVIQVIESRDRLWVRPLCLCAYHPDERLRGHQTLVEVYDLRGGSDLVWPAAVFNEALDIDWIEILTRLSPEAPALGMRASQDPTHAQAAKQKLRQFLAVVPWD